jgi:hypothetical protein
MRHAIMLSCAIPDHTDHAANPRRSNLSLLLALIVTAGAGCSASEPTAADPRPAHEEEAAQELNCNAHCDSGWDFWGNPIPFNATAGGFTVCSLANATATCTPSGWTLGASGCSASSTPYNTKFGVNSATWFDAGCDPERSAAAKGMGYYLEIARQPSDAGAVAASINCAIGARIVPIVRICDAANPCGFKNVNDYVSFLQQVDNQTNGAFWAIAGPNEPLTEKWIPGTEGIVFNNGYTDAQLDTLGARNAEYMNAVINGMNGRRRAQGGQVGLLSPAFNCTDPSNPAFVQKMRNHAANFAALDGISGNAYNVNTSAGLTITKYVNDCLNTLPGITSPFFITEMGAFESDRNPSSGSPHIPHATALANLRNQVAVLRTNSRIRGALFFDAFNTNTDPAFRYGVIADSEWPTLLSGGATLGAPSCDSNPPPANPSEDFTSMPPWTTSFDASWGNAASFVIAAGGQSGNHLQATRSAQGSSTRVRVYTLQPNRNYTISVYMRGAASSVAYWTEFAYRFGNASAQDFDQNPANWVLVQKFSNTGTNGNGDVWVRYQATFNSGANTQISIGFKSGSSGGVGPAAHWDSLLVQ